MRQFLKMQMRDVGQLWLQVLNHLGTDLSADLTILQSLTAESTIVSKGGPRNSEMMDLLAVIRESVLPLVIRLVMEIMILVTAITIPEVIFRHQKALVSGGLPMTEVEGALWTVKVPRVVVHIVPHPTYPQTEGRHHTIMDHPVLKIWLLRAETNPPLIIHLTVGRSDIPITIMTGGEWKQSLMVGGESIQ